MLHHKLYPDGTIQQLLHTDAISAATKAVLKERLSEKQVAPAYLSMLHFRILTILCRHLLALTDEAFAASIASEIDTRLREDKSNGWRYQQMPTDREAYEKALDALEEAAQNSHRTGFEGLSADQQLMLMHQLQAGGIQGENWKKLSPSLFFEELLCEATELFYSYPYAQNEIGFVGMADTHGWKKIGLNEQQSPEPPEQATHTHPYPKS